MSPTSFGVVLTGVVEPCRRVRLTYCLVLVLRMFITQALFFSSVNQTYIDHAPASMHGSAVSMACTLRLDCTP